MASVGLSGISKAYDGQVALQGIDLEVADGEFVALLGPSGCGKSTLLKIVAGLEKQSGGRLEIGGRPLLHERPAERNVAMVFQSYALYPHMTVFENLALPLAMRDLRAVERLPLLGALVPGRGARRAAIARRVEETARMLDIALLLQRRPSQLSGGQKQRVAVGRALVREPAVFLLDEPLSNLDAKLRLQMREEIVAVHRRTGVTTLYVTHDQVEAMTMADRVALMMDGVLQQVAPPEILYADPANLRVAGFVGSPPINVLPARLEGGCARLGRTRLPLAPLPAAEGAVLSLGLRPEALRLLAGPERAWFSGTLQRLEFLGSEVILSVALEEGLPSIAVKAPPEAAARLVPGSPLHLAAAMEAVLVFDESGERLRPGARPAAATAAGHG